MNRREFLECAALLIVGASASQLGVSLTHEQRQHLAAAPNYIDHKVEYLTAAQKSTLAMLTETIIPRTETPGAMDAGVPRFVELMVFEWLNEDERRLFLEGFNALMTTVQEQYQQPFDELPESTRVDILDDLEREASDSSWYAFGEIPVYVSDAPFICQLKELTIWGFFTSEVGGTQVLRYEAMPMKFDGHRKLDDDDSSWMSVMI
ncbi:gluconate 2-dehydrogenase subunit 3 family protein [Spongiibacter tropicus]|uniref:gluconate 2-dehydrogenase subunit 3 family protein n=1 Tax=Spongiibacter tropicus TaxID=454602 RepID=UPI0024E212C9|nr:gluconate 2-dehydrogenase subunit 3 family protein [Spongiibacter tropicus]